ncbi:hypothetical protein KC726_00765 [Candidatus Woesebacteria bacterium]|nr:hypothetical protein [Candidatus Woesebacteria bacterium]
MVVNRCGELKIFHVRYKDIEIINRLGLIKEHILGGIYSSGDRDTLEELETFEREYKLTLLPPPEEFIKGNFSILVDYSNREIMYSFENFPRKIRQR